MWTGRGWLRIKDRSLLLWEGNEHSAFLLCGNFLTSQERNVSFKQILIRWDCKKGKGKRKVHPCTGTEALYRPYGPQGNYSFMTNSTRRDEGSASRPGSSLPPGKTRYPLYRRLGGPQDRSGLMRKTSPPPGFDPRTIQPVASRYTDYATRLTLRSWWYLNKHRSIEIMIVFEQSV
jgi:hypothetical protein